MVGPNGIHQFVGGNGLVAGLEQFLKLAFGVGLVSQLLRLGEALAIGLLHPGAGGIVTGIKKDGAEDGLPGIGEGAGRFVDFVAGGVGPDLEMGGEAEFAAELGEGVAVIGGTSLFGGKGKVSDAILGGLVVAVIDNGMALLGYPAGIKFMVTGAVLLISASIDAFSRRGAATT